MIDMDIPKSAYVLSFIIIIRGDRGAQAQLRVPIFFSKFCFYFF